jgi:hypothetical protein
VNITGSCCSPAIPEHLLWVALRALWQPKTRVIDRVNDCQRLDVDRIRKRGPKSGTSFLRGWGAVLELALPWTEVSRWIWSTYSTTAASHSNWKLCFDWLSLFFFQLLTRCWTYHSFSRLCSLVLF